MSSIRRRRGTIKREELKRWGRIRRNYKSRRGRRWTTRENGDEEKVQDQVMRMKKSIKENNIILLIKLIFSSRPFIVSITYPLNIVN